MRCSKLIPESVREEISLYFAENEKVIAAISSESGPIGKLGELWMVLTDLNLFFFTREYGKDPVIAMLPKADVRVVTYSQNQSGVTLLFHYKTHPVSPVRIPFTKNQITALNHFCEELAKTVPFELGTPENKDRGNGSSDNDTVNLPRILKSGDFSSEHSPSEIKTSVSSREKEKAKQIPEARISVEMTKKKSPFPSEQTSGRKTAETEKKQNIGTTENTEYTGKLKNTEKPDSASESFKNSPEPRRGKLTGRGSNQFKTSVSTEAASPQTFVQEKITPSIPQPTPPSVTVNHKESIELNSSKFSGKVINDKPADFAGESLISSKNNSEAENPDKENLNIEISDETPISEFPEKLNPGYNFVTVFFSIAAGFFWYHFFSEKNTGK
ncbi:MAG: hypothetical protein HQM10_24580 [Candidatus Riflebacteria bacterium]|nr:hypothetical protein [Candidatus Riflebacteria bacterium]